MNTAPRYRLYGAEISYLLGTRPSIGDFGLIGPLYAHQYRDPASGALMRSCAPQVVSWVERMQHPPQPQAACPVLRRMMREQLPVLTGTANLLCEWMAQHPDEQRIPRALGYLPFELDGKQGRRLVGPYSLWMLQRARDAYRSFNAADRERADQLLASVGGATFAGFPDPPRLRRDGLSAALQ
jgi:hypothetical protein